MGKGEQSSKEEVLRGRCLCGAVSVEARPVAPHLDACHCAMCRRWGGIAYVAVQSDDKPRFTGEEQIGRYASSPWAERGFCRNCGSNLFYRFKPTGSYSFLAGLFDDVGDRALGEEIFVDEQPSYYRFAGETVRKTGPEVIAEAKAQGFTFD